jgi:hypothetical protein
LLRRDPQPIVDCVWHHLWGSGVECSMKLKKLACRLL